MRISDWSSDVCSSDLSPRTGEPDVAPALDLRQSLLRANGRGFILRMPVVGLIKNRFGSGRTWRIQRDDVRRRARQALQRVHPVADADRIIAEQIGRAHV